MYPIYPKRPSMSDTERKRLEEALSNSNKPILISHSEMSLTQLRTTPKPDPRAERLWDYLKMQTNLTSEQVLRAMRS